MSDLLASTRCLANLPPIAPRWLWSNRLPKGKIVLLAGPTGSGKTFLAIDIAARITTAAGFPATTSQSDPLFVADSGSDQITRPVSHSIAPGSVLLITPEEDLIDNIRPRLQAAQADVDKIISTTDLPIERLKSCTDRMDDLKLIIIDPLSFLIVNDDESLPAAKKLFDLYQHVFARSVTILALLPMHPGRGDPINRIPGITDLAPFASIIFAASLDHREENTLPDRRVLIQLKNNLSSLAPALSFTIENSTLAWATDVISDQHVNDILSKPRRAPGPDSHKLDQCVQWLYEFLAPQPRLQSEVIQAAASVGFSYGTLRRAKDELKVQSKRDKHAHWIWRVHPGVLDYDNFDQMTDQMLRQAQLPGLDSMLKPPSHI